MRARRPGEGSIVISASYNLFLTAYDLYDGVPGLEEDLVGGLKVWRRVNKERARNIGAVLLIARAHLSQLITPYISVKERVYGADNRVKRERAII